ncbi:alpha/beta fold hydrolase [Thalassococcus sp. BH17M4-6]|uniref:alpha/beta fold hydrolase n=1 Tax=Thalassococcus sp. BH17M4-6 TaxID=3413148 RepID=UPI003BE6A838
MTVPRIATAAHVRRMGHGTAPAVLLHCALAHGGAWGGVMAQLGGRIAALAPDMPGHGQSPAWDGTGDIFDLVTAAAADCLDAPAHVIGHSFGAVIALRLALECPDRVRSLMLIEPVLFRAALTEDPAAFEAYCAWDRPMADAMEAGRWDAAAQHFTASWGTGQDWQSMSQAQRDRYAVQMRLVNGTRPALMDDRAGLLAPGRLEGLRMPVRLLRGDATLPIMTPIHRALARRVPGAQNEVVEGAGHMLPISHPGATAQHIATLLDRV